MSRIAAGGPFQALDAGGGLGIRNERISTSESGLTDTIATDLRVDGAPWPQTPDALQSSVAEPAPSFRMRRAPLGAAATQAPDAQFNIFGDD